MGKAQKNLLREQHRALFEAQADALLGEEISTAANA